MFAPSPTSRSAAWRTAAAGSGAAALAAGLIAYLAVGAHRQAPVVRRAYVKHYDGRVLTDPFEIMLVQSDGQAYAALARDPSLARPEEFPSRAEAAYRAQRPLLGWLAWAASLGRPSRVPVALAVLQVVGVGAAGAACAALLAGRGAPVFPAALVALLPGIFESLSWLGPEALGLALAAWGVGAWERARAGRAGVLLSAAALARETLLVVPAGLLLASLRHGSARPRHPWPAAIGPFAVVALWACVVRLRIGSWPLLANTGRLGFPLEGLARAAGTWADPGDAFFLGVAATLALGVAAWRRADRNLFAIILVTCGLALVMGPAVWARWEDFTRPLLPLFAFGAVALLGRPVQVAGP